jgi:hypothetical protein
MKTVTVSDFAAMSANVAKKTLQTLASQVKTGEKKIIKLLVAREEKGDFGKGEMNSWSQEVTGLNLRDEIQGIYECCHVVRAMRAGSIDFTDTEFEEANKWGLMRLGTLIKKDDKAKIAEAIAIIRSGEKVTERIKALFPKGKGKGETDKEKSGKSGKGSGESKSDELPEIQTPPGKTFFIPKGTAILQSKELLKAIMAEIKSAPDADSCEAYHELFKGLTAHVHSRWETLEAKAAEKAAKKGEKVAA